MMKRPINPYSPDWNQYWAENPSMRRGVGSDAAEGGEEAGGEAEGGEETAPASAEWASGIEDESLRGTMSKYESQEAALAAIGYKAPEPTETDWREGLPDDLRKTADRFTSKEDAIRAIGDLRKRESQVRVPGKDASEDEVKAYHKAVGVPETPEGYEWPDLGEEVTEAQQASRDAWSQKLHEKNVPRETAKELAAFMLEEQQAALTAEIEADKVYAQQQDDALKAEWKGEAYEKNDTLANRAFTDMASRAGLNVEELTRIETKDGRFLMDDARMKRIFAIIGKESSEGTIGPTLTSGERETVGEQISELRGKITAAQNAGDSNKANQLYEKEQALIAKLKGNNTVVGSQGRAV